MKGQPSGTCELCGRSPLATTVHHLVPREKGGALQQTALLCKACHRQIHALYTNDDLVVLGLTTVEALQHDPQFSSYLKWIGKQAPGSEPKLRKSQRVRGKR
ncbi:MULTISPECIES: HNH endonuclease signature motif containing protein [unclassified Paenibacillus]|uniref:HNH endonuclease n=1 Tax=unclassified Paenibacillus TaxID=185978 RepID=UPI0024065AE4|nr:MULTISPECIES: HNH endonuclease signature motif containing protein [unclassified Paenibacillus]MDF9842965.1 5-methylcytosine-specific restriction protein A [Paenibacillus sp. PastF-2]MDF9849553.1 5-methylcytosine-specific restriction protein A [Paenibacillus sp. PastM-2]MDF9856072.1 5-methylcytosine-specific restriction protein A [Paenibacillus sp. PastF-1]MDH6481396.1 5-methylcytosine-specific restriction protein A [Paenibacillus sp. PastH-2]MDH6508761.1 5-methylcytosine-specific restrictio